ncbi:amidohydrolase family protein [Parapusillimonas granuli]|uniref:Amidohydrolase family protein n=1 Tax=Parapusillimonas granuli TaxID=380911 RepID=A0A853FSV4_9BURK|nr:amidohydrolase family protein [Parapusillimonas granuli]MBB5214647.1 putative TIM-barrel fold metal-dependent hydrolase [Parapusillimonas granuli]NYT48945.1 amidohydrolase family protein [Parapusillimonas granuli]
MHDSDGKPAFTAPPKACDSHFHVFGPAGQYGYGTELRYDPPHAPLEDYLELARRLGLTRFVFVQPSAYGRDNRCMLDAMKQMALPCRGIVDVDENESDATLGALDATGVCGVRINVRPIMPAQPGFGATLAPRIERLAARCAELGWHLDFLLPDWLTIELLPVLRALRLPYSIAHLGMQKARDGADAAGFRQVLDLARNGNCYLKITGIYRISTAPGFSDVAPMVHAALDAAPDRLIWGSDYPHLSFGENSSVELFNLLGAWVPDPAMRQRILSDNPARLYRF